MRLFPQNFFWGTAISAHQVEGNNVYNDWWDAEQRGFLPHKSGKACDSYNRYEEDFDLAKAMANNAHRFSIEWSRIEPEEGKFSEDALEHYRKVVHALCARGLEPFVTLHHFTNPIWFAKKGGWTNKKAPEYFERYVECVVARLGKAVRYWITINEPMVVLGAGYVKGDWPPFHRKDFFGFLLSLRHMAKAHKRVYALLHRLNPRAQVGIAQSVNYFEPAGRGLLGVLDAPRLLLTRRFKNELFLDKIKNAQDFVGLNYYNHYKVSLWKGKFQDGSRRSDFGWEIYPEGVCRVVKEAYARYKKPIFITENGISDADDDQRPDFLREHLFWLHKAIEDGVDVRGYFHWSLLDNFEWAEGFTQRFGLVEVNFVSLREISRSEKILKRTLRPSGKLYGEICRNNGI